jgi:hypothetical protein
MLEAMADPVDMYRRRRGRAEARRAAHDAER